MPDKLYTNNMHKHPTKKQQIARLVLIYTVMSVTVVLIVIALVFIMLGYTFNREYGKLEQGGLVQLNSQPGNANVTINGSQTSLRTPDKLTIGTGQHLVKMSKNGYHDWEKSATVSASDVLWLNYARLIPKQLEQKKLLDFKEVSGSLASPDRKQIIIKQEADTPTFTLVRITDDQPKITELALPNGSFVPADENHTAHSYKLKLWEKNNRYVLVRHDYRQSETDKTEWLVIDTRDMAQTKNVTTLLGVNASKIEFSLGDDHILYGLIDGELRKLNINDATLSRPLVSNLADFEQFDRATVTFETKLDPESSKRSVGYFTDNAKQPRIVRSFADDGMTPLKFRVNEYFKEKYLVYLYGETFEIVKGDLPSSDSKSVTKYTPVTTMTLPNGGDYLTLGPNKRFVVVQKQSEVMTYDLELDQSTTVELTPSEHNQKIAWLDDFHYVAESGGEMKMYEFDGQNPMKLMRAQPGHAFTMSDNKKYIYGIQAKPEGGATLDRIKIVID